MLCFQYTRAKAATESKTEAEGIGHLFETLAIVSTKMVEKKAEILLEDPARVLYTDAKLRIVSASRRPKEVSSVIAHVIFLLSCY